MNEPNENKRPMVVLQSREVMTQNQIAPILHMTQVLVGCLNGPQSMFLSEESPKSPALDGGVRSAIETTIIRACSRLDAILAEEGRWTVSESPVEKYLTAQTNLATAQARLAEHAQKPHVIHKPNLVKLSDGSWCAISGDIDQIPQSITGIGRTPQEALEAWDGMFTGQIPQSLLDFINGIQSHKENTEHDQQNELDKDGDRDSSEDEDGGEDKSRDSGEVGPDSDLGGAKA